MRPSIVSTQLCLYHQAQTRGLIISRSLTGITISGPLGTESLGLACYRDRVHLRAILDGAHCDCPSPPEDDPAPYEFGRCFSLLNSPFSSAEYFTLVELKRRLASPDFVR